MKAPHSIPKVPAANSNAPLVWHQLTTCSAWSVWHLTMILEPPSLPLAEENRLTGRLPVIRADGDFTVEDRSYFQPILCVKYRIKSLPFNDQLSDPDPRSTIVFIENVSRWLLGANLRSSTLHGLLTQSANFSVQKQRRHQTSLLTTDQTQRPSTVIQQG